MVMLLEREEPLQALRDALRETVAASGRVVLIEGEAGIGKTALVERFIRVHGPPARVLWGACDDLFTPRPLAPISDMAAQLGSSLPALLETPGQWSALCAAMLTELQSQPTIAVVEDLHWVDEGTLELLLYLARRLEHTRALLVLTYRTDTQGPQHPLWPALTELRALPGCKTLTLRPLSIKAIHVLLGEAGRSETALAAADMHRLTGGNPFFVGELLREHDDALPATVRDVVLARTARLPSQSLEALQAVAVIGPRCDAALLRAVLGASGSVRPFEALDACIAAGLLVGDGARLSFRHEVARAVIHDSIAPGRRRALYQRTLMALETRHGSAVARAELAHHAQGAANTEAIRLYAPAAAREAVAARMHRAAAKLYALALSQGGAWPPVERAELLLAYSVECDVADNRPEAIAAVDEARALYAAAADPLGEGRCLNRLSLLLQVVGRRADAEVANRAALALLEPHSPNRELISTYNVAAWLSLSQTDHGPGIALVEKALALVEHFESETDLPRLYEIAGLLWLTRDPGRGQAYLERALETALRLDHVTRAGNIYANLSLIMVDFHQFERAEALLAAGLPFAREHDLDFAGAMMTGYQAVLTLHHGDWPLAERLASSALGRGPSSPGRGPALLALGRLRARRGHGGAAFEALDEALDLLLGQGFRQLEGLVRAARAEAAWESGDWERSQSEARAAIGPALEQRHPWYVGELAYWLWRAGVPLEPLPSWTARPYALQIGGLWHAAAEAWAALGCPYEQARALADGDTQARAQARAIFDRLGARPAARAPGEHLRRAGHDNPGKPQPTGQDTRNNLTRRQTEILGLIVQGLSNPEIASRLKLSPKTVDHHVSAILARLNVATRGEAARLARER
ncbi:MAG TPA: AAA family ATPase [Anaerolineales bacterium]|nr:AAA family ATPase [Anaerolineales bacterium]